MSKNVVAILLFVVAAILLLPKLIGQSMAGFPKVAQPPTPAPPAPTGERNTLGQIIGGITTILPIIKDWSHPSSSNVQVSGGSNFV